MQGFQRLFEMAVTAVDVGEILDLSGVGRPSREIGNEDRNLLRQILRRLRSVFPTSVLRVRLDGGFVSPKMFAFLDQEKVEKALELVDHLEQLDNLSELTRTHRVTRSALFDQFPYTHHMECGVLLERK